jgi:hypothetical protein
VTPRAVVRGGQSAGNALAPALDEEWCVDASPRPVGIRQLCKLDTTRNQSGKSTRTWGLRTTTRKALTG